MKNQVTIEISTLTCKAGSGVGYTSAVSDYQPITRKVINGKEEQFVFSVVEAEMEMDCVPFYDRPYFETVLIYTAELTDEQLKLNDEDLMHLIYDLDGEVDCKTYDEAPIWFEED